MVSEGADHAKYDGTEQAAKDIIGRMVDRSPVYLDIQEELHAGRHVDETGAWQILIGELQRRLQSLQTKVDNIQDKLSKADEQNEELKEELNRTYQDALRRLVNYQESIRTMTSQQDTLLQRIEQLEAENAKRIKCIVS